MSNLVWIIWILTALIFFTGYKTVRQLINSQKTSDVPPFQTEERFDLNQPWLLGTAFLAGVLIGVIIAGLSVTL